MADMTYEVRRLKQGLMVVVFNIKSVWPLTPG